MTRLSPTIGDWYQNTDSGAIFEIVAVDEDDETIELQHLDGEVEEYDFEQWQEMGITRVSAPEDWRVGFEISREDAPNPDAVIHPDTGDVFEDLDEDDADFEDDWEEDD